MSIKLMILLALPFVLIFSAVLYAMGLNLKFPKMAGDGRQPNKYEYLYYNLALKSQDNSFCAKISDKAYTAASFAVKRGIQIKYFKSECYGNLASESNNTLLCDNIKPINSWFFDGSKYTKQNCTNDITKSPHIRGIPLFQSYINIKEIMQELKYDLPHDASLEDIDNELKVAKYYQDLEDTKEFWEKVKALPSF